jgi:cellulose synthase/poly-beta-1,6-N-acetylglucosamine synthase-like glycosyltransferase
MPFEGLPAWAAALYWIAFVVIVGMLVWTTALFVSSRRALRSAPAIDPGGADEFLWVFLVPALNEVVTIADSVNRLLAVDVPHKVVLVVDDGSSDGTAAALAAIEHADLEVLGRELPDARQGKAAALNAGWAHLETLLASARLSAWTRERVIVVVVDADGRLELDAPRHAAAHFQDPRVGGVQVLVRIYNRASPLTWCQDVEFSIYGLLFQAGRTRAGTAGMGGNGQFNRLSALDDVVDPEAPGPWRDRLTEDQDLGLRLIEAGWRGVAEARTSVDQQGLPGLRRLFRQRTRWAQGNLQAMSHLGAVARANLPVVRRLDLLLYLLQPALQAIVGVAFVASIVLAILDVADYWGDSLWWQLLFFFVLGYGGVALGCIARGARTGAAGVLRSILIIPVYAAYSWLLWPVLVRATFRLAVGRRSWAKTARQPIEG